ncbi:MAG TPA: EscU/YscU/HrcU family type III secretion system export apparatus switch protein [Polyangia bacterium]|nr:EscU/YscU/HrcU family type III secretion system export apparatus switch protein [Polyangia bacterium]
MAPASQNATEDPTPRRLAEARRRGQVAVSRELTSAAALVAAVAVLAVDAPAVVARVVAALRAGLGAAVAGGAPSQALGAASSLGLRMLAPALVAIIVATVVVGLAQTRGLVTAPARPALGRLAPADAWRRLFDGRAARQCALGLLKIALVAAVAWLALRPLVGAVVGLPGTVAPRLLAILGATAERLAVRLAAAALVLGVVDAVLVARRHSQSLRMTRDEVRRDLKESQGDPARRRERQRLHREIAGERANDLRDDVRGADFVVVGDAAAVAVRYEADAAAPTVVAKGDGLVAARIRQVAREAGVARFVDFDLARALLALPEGGEIPPALYEAVAELLRAVRASAPAVFHGAAEKRV